MTDAERESVFDIVIPARLLVNTNDPAWSEDSAYEIASYLAAEFVIPAFSDSDVAFPDLCEITARGPVVILGEAPEEDPRTELDRFIDWLYEVAPPRDQAIERPRGDLLRSFRDFERKREPGRSHREPSPAIEELVRVAVEAEVEAETVAERQAKSE